MKKGIRTWLIAALGILVGQAVTIFSKEKTLRKNMSETPWLLWKAKLFWAKWLETNKKIVEEVSTTDWDQTVTNLREDTKHDIDAAKGWIDEKKNSEWVKETKDNIDTILEKAPTKSQVEETVKTYKTRVQNRWNWLLDEMEKISDNLESKAEEAQEKIEEKVEKGVKKTSEVIEKIKSKVD